MPLDVRHLTTDDYRELPWKNGGGTTREVAVWPPGSAFERGDFTWRVALARVAEEGPFSRFEGFERLLVVVRGRGLVLTHGDVAPRAAVPAYVPYRFGGDWPTRAEPLGGPVDDLNVLFDAERVHATIDVLRLGARRWRGDLAAGHALLHLAIGTAIARVTGEEESITLREGDALIVGGLAGGEELELSGRADDTLALHVALERR